MAKWSTLINGEDTRDAQQEKLAWKNGRVVHESPAACGWLATTWLR